MTIMTFVKDVDDFGRKPISDTHAEFEVIVYMSPKEGDILLFIYPDKGTHLLYRIEGIHSKFTKDLPYIFTGVMVRLILEDQPVELYNSVCIEMEKVKNRLTHS